MSRPFFAPAEVGFGLGSGHSLIRHPGLRRDTYVISRLKYRFSGRLLVLPAPSATYPLIRWGMCLLWTRSQILACQFLHAADLACPERSLSFQKISAKRLLVSRPA